jgi:hypothetical protein
MPTWLIWTLGLGVPLAAAAVPVIIHLINLTRYRKVEWAAMEFLLAAYKRTRRRMQMESLIMLLLRVMAVILLAAALFPMGCQQVKAWADDQFGWSRGALSADAPLHLLLVLDNSASMAYQGEGQTAFDRARQFAIAAVDSLTPNRDRVSLIRLSDVYVPPGAGGLPLTEEEAERARARRVGQSTSLSLDAARRELASTQVAAVDTNMLAALREAARLAETTPERDAVGLLVVSDFVEAGWRELMPGAAVHTDFQAVLGRLSERMSRGGTRPLFYDAGFDNTRNVAVTGLRVNERVVGNGMEVRVRVELDYYASGDTAERRTARLRYRVDGGPERPFTAPIELLPGRHAEGVELVLPARELALRPEEAATGASRHIEISTEEPDALRADNTRHLVIHVVPNVPILVVNGRPHPDVSRDETFYLETALGIHTSRIEGERSDEPEVRITPNHIVTMRPEQLAAVDSFFDYRIVVLANVPEVPDAVTRRLEEFVAAGFSLLVFDGDLVDTTRYNSLLFNEGRGLLPARLGRPGGSDDRITAARHGLAFGDTSHPVLRLFDETDQTRALVTNPKMIFNWREVSLPEGTSADPRRPVTTLLKLDLPGEQPPLMLERPFGRGRVIYVATTSSDTWHELWRGAGGLPLFLYLQVAEYLADSEARYSNLAVGETWRRVLREGDVAPRYTVRDPAGTVLEIPATLEDTLKLVEFGGTTQPGVYTLTAQDRAGDGEYRRRWQERFAVNLPARESNVARLRGEDGQVQGALREALGEEAEFLYRRAGEELEGGGVLGVQDSNREWIWLAAFAVMFLALETIWSGVISKPEQ